MANRVVLDGGSAPRKPSLQQVIGGAYNTPTAPPPSIARPPAQTYQPRTPSSYIAPIPNYVPQYSPPAPGYAPPANTNWGGGGSTAGFGGGGNAMANPGASGAGSAPSTPAPKPMSESDWLAGDTEYQNELTGYDNTLKDFLARIATQENDFTTDFGTAMKGFGRNRDRSMLNLGEDFTSRGLANSGMFADSRTKANAQFEDQENGLELSKTRGLADFGTQRSDKKRSTETQKGNARRSSLARMAQKEQF